MSFPVLFGRAIGSNRPLVLDLFVDTEGTALASHTPDIDTVGTGWTEVVSGITIESNRASDNQADRQAVIDAGVADCRIRVDLVANSVNFTGIIFRYQNSTNFLIAGADTIFSRVAIWKNVAGVFTNLAGNTTPAIPQGTAGTLDVRLLGSNIKLLWDGVEYLDITETTGQSETEHGLYEDGDTWSADATWDNFRIQRR